jgi:site-specific recombinase XerD
MTLRQSPKVTAINFFTMENVKITHDRFCDYCITFKGNTQKTIRWYRGSIRSLLKYQPIELLKEIDQNLIESWIFNGKIENDWSPKSIKNHLLAISLFVDWCVERKLIEENFVKKIPKPKIPKSLPKHLCLDDAMLLLEWSTNLQFKYRFEHYRSPAIIGLFMYTGVRLSELVNLKVNEVDLHNKSLFIKCGKGKKDRVIPLHPSIIELLKKYLKERQRIGRECPYFFTSLKYDQKMDTKTVNRLVWKLRDKSGIYFYPHLLRHTFATLMLEGGCDIFSLSKMMGHSDIKTTTIYLSATTSHLQEQIKKHPLDCCV